MAGADLSTHFEKISNSAKAANDKIKAAGKKTTDQLDADLASARAKASAAADRLDEKADAADDKAWSRSQEVCRKWQAHVAEVRANIEKKKAKHDVKEAERSAKLPLGCIARSGCSAVIRTTTDPRRRADMYEPSSLNRSCQR